MEEAKNFDYFESPDSPIEKPENLSIGALRRKRAIERKKDEELTQKMHAAGIPTGKISRPASSINHKTKRHGGNHRRGWRD